MLNHTTLTPKPLLLALFSFSFSCPILFATLRPPGPAYARTHFPYSQRKFLPRYFLSFTTKKNNFSFVFFLLGTEKHLNSKEELVVPGKWGGERGVFFWHCKKKLLVSCLFVTFLNHLLEKLPIHSCYSKLQDRYYYSLTKLILINLGQKPVCSNSK